MIAPDAKRDSLIRRIYNINENDFEGVALQLWKYQYEYNPLYRSYCDLLGVEAGEVQNIDDIPFLPIAVFRQHEVKTGYWEAEKIFRSSGTTGSIQSKHLVRDLRWYHDIAGKCFSITFRSPADYAWIGLLPSYLERTDSSLVDMVHYFMSCGGYEQNRFFPKINEEIISDLALLKRGEKPTVLIGVSFALLDLFAREDVPVWENLLVIETGGMKGRGQEMTREELYGRISEHHHGLRITSEYGMTELMSQAYRIGEHFQPGPTMHARMRDISDPLRLIDHGQRGVINIIDLGNIDTCAFIATDDVGISFPDGSFEVLGRLDNSDLRGCNLMYV